MTDKAHADEKRREGIMRTLASFGRGRAAIPAPAEAAPSQNGRVYPTPPSRRTRKSMTTWQDAMAIKQIKAIAHEEGISQQRLIAEAFNMLFAKYGKPTVAT